MRLSETIDNMVSTDYKKRFKGEYEQTLIRYNALDDMCVKYEAGTLDFEPDTPLSMLFSQKRSMGEYLHILKVRAQIERIEL